jgi:hypothetical protein
VRVAVASDGLRTDELSSCKGRDVCGKRRGVCVVRAAGETHAQIAVDGETFLLEAADLDRLLIGLRRVDRHDARQVVEQISALRVAGGVIRLSLTIAELRTVDHALLALGAEPAPVTQALERFARFCESLPITVDR